MKTKKRKIDLKILSGAVFIILLMGVVGAFAFQSQKNFLKTPSTKPNSSSVNALGDPNTSTSTHNISSDTPPAIPKTTNPQASPSAKITVTSPTQGATVSSGTMVRGAASVPDNVVYYRLKGSSSGQVAAYGPIPVNGGKFSFELQFTKQADPSGEQGTLEIYNPSDPNDSVNVNVEVRG